MKKLAIGIDIGGTNASFGFVSTEGKVLNKKSYPIKNFKTAKSFVDFTSKEIANSVSNLNSSYEISGIGIGAPNGNFYTGAIEFAPNLEWNGFIPLASMFHESTGYKSFLTNDANAAAIGEMVYGDAKDLKNFVMITLGTGVGSGFVANGELILGYDGFAGELGHTIFDPNGRQCNCGRCGCVETYASATGIVRTAKEFLTKFNEKSLLHNADLDKLSSKDIYNAALQKDKIALKVFDYTGYVLGFSLANAIAITSPEAIFLFGGLANAGDLIFRPTKKYMEKYLLNIFKNKVELRKSGLPENDAAIIGAAALVWDH
ncbi:MAG: ROK family protein [Bacteroidales bacterium]|nr:ROK family protein [Bacteroidales bacterium]